jgi:hypothetical protein
LAIVTGRSTHSVGFTQAAPATVIGNPTVNVSETPAYTYSNGTALSSTDLLHSRIYSLTASTPQTIDLTALLDPWGGAVNFARVRSILLRNTGSSSITVGAAATNAWVGPLGTTTSTLIIPGGAIACFEDPSSLGTAGWVVGATSKSIKLDPGTSNGTLEVILAGGSAAS